VPRNVKVNLETPEGEVTINSSEVRSLKLNETENQVQIRAGSKKLTVDPGQVAKLSDFQKKQWEKLVALKAKKKK
jgi:hypothetical protein